jgi:hypothetical protein
MAFSFRPAFIACIIILFAAMNPAARADQPDFRTGYAALRINDRILVFDFKKSGNQLYYTSVDLESGGLFAIRDDGTANERIAAGRVTNVVLADHEIYFTRMEDSGSTGLFRYDAEKKSEELVVSDMFFDPPVFFKGYFYLSVQDRGFFKISADGKEKVKIHDGILFSPVIDSRGIYGWGKTGDEWSLVRIDPVSMEVRPLLQDTPGYLVLSGNTLFLASANGLFSVNAKTGAKKKLSDDEVNGNFFVVRDRLYFHSYNEGRTIMTMKADGTDRKPVFREKNNRLLYADGDALYFYHGDSLSTGPTADTYLGKYFFKEEMNPQRLFPDMPVQLLFVSNRVMIGTAPGLGDGTFALYPDRKKAVPFTTDQVVQVVGIDGETVYYVREYDDSVLCSKTLSGKGEARILARVSGSASLAGNRILYANPEDEDALYGVDLKSGAARKISGLQAVAARGDAKNAYLLTPVGQYYSLVQVDLATLRETGLKTGMILSDVPIFVLSGNMLYYTDGGVLYGYDCAKKAETVLDKALNGFVFNCIATKRYLYYTVDVTGVDGITRLSRDGREKVKIADGELFGLAYDSGFLYWFRDYAETMPSAEGPSFSYRIKADE